MDLEEQKRLEDEFEELELKIRLVYLGVELPPELKNKRDDVVTAASQFFNTSSQNIRGKDEGKRQESQERARKLGYMVDKMVEEVMPSPHFYAFRFMPPVSLGMLRKNTIKKGETLLVYFISQNKLYVLSISKEDFEVVPIGIEKAELDNIINEYLSILRRGELNEIRIFGKVVYGKLFSPLEEVLSKNRHVIVIPDGELSKIPFESFVIGETKSERPEFLLEKYQIKYIPSGSVLSELRSEPLSKLSATYHVDKKSRNFIGFGDPIYDYESFKEGQPEQDSAVPHGQKDNRVTDIYRSRYIRAGGLLTRLSGSGEEIRAIARLFERGALKCVIRLREDATEDNAKAEGMKNFDFIHFACHGIFGGGFQSLALSQDIPGSKEDGYFTLNEAMNCNYNAQLVVLSGCRTGSGEVGGGENIAGLARAFMYTGTPAVVASLWKVDDTATKELMVKFYENMLEKNMDKVEALRQAKLELLETQTFSSPYFWSAFIMYGE